MNMMISTEGTLDVRQSALGNHLERETKREGNASQGLRGAPKIPAAGIQSVKQELDAVRREQGKVQQAIYEAAQIQRKLCAPRELVWGEFEIAGEIFPVRHLSGDFFKVMELGSALGLTVGDIAGKGLSARIRMSRRSRPCSLPDSIRKRMNLCTVTPACQLHCC
jgi:serine phosphatase RsbU (regulator of sigma subunit)